MKANPIQCYFVACQAVSTGFVEPSRIAVRIPTLHCFKGHVPMETSTTIYIWIRKASDFFSLYHIFLETKPFHQQPSICIWKKSEQYVITGQLNAGG